MEKIADKPLTQRLIDGLRDAAVELEEFQVDLYLGKAEARDKYEEAKHRLQNSIQEAKEWIKAEEQEIQILLQELKDKLSEQKASTVKELEQQKERIAELILKTEEIAKAKGSKIFSEEKLGHELEKFKIKMEMIPLQFALMKMEVKDQAWELRKRVLRKLEDIEDNLRDEGKEMKENISELYQRLKGAF